MAKKLVESDGTTFEGLIFGGSTKERYKLAIQDVLEKRAKTDELQVVFLISHKSCRGPFADIMGSSSWNVPKKSSYCTTMVAKSDKSYFNVLRQ